MQDVMTLETWMLAALVAVIAGVVKGIVGFAMPMIMVLGLGAFLPPETTVAALIGPTLLTNGIQALRLGPRSAWHAVQQFRVFLLVGGAVMLFSAQLVLALPQDIYSILIGVPIIGFVVMQIAGWVPNQMARDLRIESGVATVAGFMGGLSGIWGPPTVAYLTSLGTPKQVQIQVQGVIYGLGAVLLVFAHWGSGVLNARTFWVSFFLTVPAVLGMLAGTSIQDRINQTVFRRATLLVLLVAGFNLLRRGLIN